MSECVRGGAPPLCSIALTASTFYGDNQSVIAFDGLEEIKIKLGAAHLLYPRDGWKKTMNGLGIEDDYLVAREVSYRKFYCKGCSTEQWSPVVRGTPLNPYVALRNASASASRSLSKLEALTDVCELDDVYLMGWTLTYPKEASEKLVPDEAEMKRVSEMAYTIFMEWFRCAYFGEHLKLASKVNTHTWSTERPWQAHLHHHSETLNYGWNEETATFERRNPVLSPELLESAKEAWKTIMLEMGLLEDETKNVDVRYQYMPLKQHGRVLHALTYQNRSIVIDLAEYFNKHPSATVTEELIEGFKNTFKHGATNKATVYGYWHHLEGVVKKWLENDRGLEQDAMIATGETELTEEGKKVLKELRCREFERFRAMSNRKYKYCPLCGEKMEYVEEISVEKFNKKYKHLPVVDIWEAKNGR